MWTCQATSTQTTGGVKGPLPRGCQCQHQHLWCIGRVRAHVRREPTHGRDVAKASLRIRTRFAASGSGRGRGRQGEVSPDPTLTCMTAAADSGISTEIVRTPSSCATAWSASTATAQLTRSRALTGATPLLLMSPYFLYFFCLLFLHTARIAMQKKMRADQEQHETGAQSERGVCRQLVCA